MLKSVMLLLKNKVGFFYSSSNIWYFLLCINRLYAVAQLQIYYHEQEKKVAIEMHLLS